MSKNLVKQSAPLALFRGPLGFLAIAAILAVALLWSLLSPTEPAYNGKRLSLWLQELDRANTGQFTKRGQTPEQAEARKLAETAISEMGAKAGPALLAMLRATDSPAKLKFLAWAEKQSMINFRFARASVKRSQALEAWGILPIAARRQAIPELDGLLDDPERALTAASALATMGIEAAQPMQRALTNSNVSVRETAVYGLAACEPVSEAIMLSIAQAFHDKEDRVRQSAVGSFVKWAGQPNTSIPPQVVPLLIEALQDSSQLVRVRALYTLQSIGPGAKAAVPQLLKLLETRDCPHVATALRHIAPQSGVNGLLKALHIPKDWVGPSSADALGEYGQLAKDAVPTLVQAMGNSNPNIARAAAKALKKIDPQLKSPRVLSDIAAHLRNESRQTRRLAAATLADFGVFAQAARPNLVAAIHSEENRYVRADFEKALAKITSIP